MLNLKYEKQLRGKLRHVVRPHGTISAPGLVRAGPREERLQPRWGRRLAQRRVDRVVAVASTSFVVAVDRVAVDASYGLIRRLRDGRQAQMEA